MRRFSTFVACLMCLLFRPCYLPVIGAGVIAPMRRFVGKFYCKSATYYSDSA
jgi:hypothetical protein